MSGIADALASTGASVAPSAPLQRLAYWRVGGPAEWLVEAHDLEQLRGISRVCAERALPLTVLGKGSNALIHDDGVPGVTLALRGQLADLEIDGERAVAGAGLALVVLLSRLDRAGLAGAEPFAGVPGTVGGAVVMNAGTRLGEAKDLVLGVTAVLPGGEVVELSREALGFRYRHSELPAGAVVAAARLQLTREDVDARRARRQEMMRRRKASQPLSLPSCGSTFTNPPGDYAGRLIEAAGLKGLRRGGAAISEQHANFIVNLGEATAEDIRWLIAHARCEVRERFGIWMTPEVQLMGAWGPEALERA